MKNLASLILSLVCSILVMPISGCYENSVTPTRTNTNTNTLDKTISNKTIFDLDRDFPEGFPDGDLPEGNPESDSWRYPYPTIIEREFIPPYDFFSETKCFAWRITWPAYDGSADEDKIPTVFATVNGALNSFDYLNSVDPQNTYKTDFSLFYDDKVEASASMWEVLDYADVSEGMEVPYFALSEQPLDNIIDWVTERPDLFELHWPGSSENELDYNEGDFIQYWLSDANLYGGIRIVSMEPRIIEVYLAVPNN